MSETSKVSVAIAMIVALAVVAIFGLMADCSKSVSRTGSDAVEACVRRGGVWAGNNDGQAPNLDTCIEPTGKSNG